MDRIRIRTPSVGQAQRLVAALEGVAERTTVDSEGATSEVALVVGSETATKVVELFDVLDRWLRDGGLDAVQIGFGKHTYTLLATAQGASDDPSRGLLERTLQFQDPLDCGVVVEQAKGIIAEREWIDPDAAFERIRREALSRRIKLTI